MYTIRTPLYEKYIQRKTWSCQVSELPARELVPGDVVELHVGDRVPADIRVLKLKTATLRAEQASLTGESVAVLKSVDPVMDEACELQAKVGHCSLIWSFRSASQHYCPVEYQELQMQQSHD